MSMMLWKNPYRVLTLGCLEHLSMTQLSVAIPEMKSRTYEVKVFYSHGKNIYINAAGEREGTLPFRLRIMNT